MEIWKKVKGYELFYEVSNLGNVRSIAVYSGNYHTVFCRKEPLILRQETTRDGYKRVVLTAYGKKKHFAVHRLVAAAFVENEKNLPAVNHIDENTANNNSDNLEWVTPKQNSNHGTLRKRISIRQTNAEYHSKVVMQCDLNGKMLATYPSVREATRITSVGCDNIYRCCKGLNKSAGGFKWKYKNGYMQN